jgi:sRNA-binding regulator protein Hfq
MSKNTVCPVTVAQFKNEAKPVVVTLNGSPMQGEVKEFSTGSLGWNVNGRISQTFATRQEFKDGAKAMSVVVNGIPMQAEVKEFSTGSLGWYLNGKLDLTVGDTKVKCQVGGNITIVDSKKDQTPTAKLDGRVQVGINLTIVGSKELPE